MNVETETESLVTSETPSEEEQTETTEETNTEEEEETSEEETSEEAPVTLSVEDITFSEELQINDETKDDFLGILNNRELSPKDQAQALINLQEKVAQEASEAGSQLWADQQKEWQDEVKNDPTLGGGNFQKTLSTVSSLVEQFGSEELVEVMAATGAGNNIHVIRFLEKVSAKALEGKAVTGSPNTSSGDRASRMFPSMKG